MTWDYLILTASDDAQAAAYRSQIEVRKRIGLLGDVRRVLVVPDPGGRRVGSGGSTICCLTTVLARELGSADNAACPETWLDVLRRMRILIIHCGGDSRRLPAYGPCGKVFVPVPGGGDSAVSTTLFDRQLPFYLRLPPAEAGSGQIVIASGDVLLSFSPDEVCFAPSGITGLACAAPPGQASRHGVYRAVNGGRVRRFLQKPSPAEQSEAGAIDAYGQSLLDVGVIHLDAETAVRLLELCGTRPEADGRLSWSGPMAEEITRLGLDFYREICCAMGEETTLDAYRAAVRSSGSAWADALLTRLYQTVADVPCRVHTLSRCEFLHFGTTWQILASGRELLRREEGFAAPNVCLDINNRKTDGAELIATDSWIEGCTIDGRVELPGHNVMVGVDVDGPLALPPHGCLDLLPGRSREGESVTFVRCYHVKDSFDEPAGDDTLFCGHPLGRWLASAGASPEDLWCENVADRERSLWNARLFPAVGDGAEYRRWLWMLEPAAAADGQFQSWRRARRYSLEEMARLADREAFEQRRLAIRTADFLESLPRYFRPESSFSAADLAHLLSRRKAPGRRIARILGEARRRTGQEDTDSPGEAFAFSRIVHTVGSVVAERGEGTLTESLPCLREILGADLVGPPDDAEAGTPAGNEAEDWAERAHGLAFRYMRKRIIASGTSATGPPANALRSDEIVWGRAPARLDLAGGWTDTPPYSLEHGGTVVNAAVDLNGQPPIQVYARVTPEPLIRIRSIDVGTSLEIARWDQLVDFHSATGEFSLVKAALVLSGFDPRGPAGTGGRDLRQALLGFGGGLELTTLAAIPKGSGLGTSSIMGAVILAVVHRVMGHRLSHTELFHAVLRLEQTLATGGGWQDQIGGSVGGLKLITTAPGMVPEATIRYLPADVLDPGTNGAQTLLYYTGITRRAKNILQQVVGRYLDRDREAVATLGRMHDLAHRTAETVARKDLEQFGRLVDTAWRLNKRLDPKSTNDQIEALLARIRPHVHGAKLLGAGGGGFLLMVYKSASEADRARRLLESDPPNDRARFFGFSVNQQGLEVSVC